MQTQILLAILVVLVATAAAGTSKAPTTRRATTAAVTTKAATTKPATTARATSKAATTKAPTTRKPTTVRVTTTTPFVRPSTITGVIQFNATALPNPASTTAKGTLSIIAAENNVIYNSDRTEVLGSVQGHCIVLDDFGQANQCFLQATFGENGTVTATSVFPYEGPVSGVVLGGTGGFAGANGTFNGTVRQGAVDSDLTFNFL